MLPVQVATAADREGLEHWLCIEVHLNLFNAYVELESGQETYEALEE